MRGTIPAPRAVNAQLLAGRAATCYTVAENLLVNSHFDVWQRGEQIDNVGTTAYGPDMWTGNGNLPRTYSRQRNGVKIITTEAGQFAGISQRRVLPLRYYADRNATMTLRYRVYAYARDMLTYQGAHAPARQWATSIWRGNLAITGEGVINCTDLIGVQCLADGSDLPAGSEFTIADVELVLGEYTDDTFPMVRQVSYVEELAECQRYYWQVHFEQYETIGLGYESPAYSFVQLSAPTQIQTKYPTLTQSAPVRLGNTDRIFTNANCNGTTIILGMNHPQIANPAGSVYGYSPAAGGVTFSLSVEP